MVLTIILVIGFILYFFYAYGQRNNERDPSYSNRSNDSDNTRQKRHYSEVGKYEREKLVYCLKGVAFGNKSEAFDEIDNGDIVTVRFDANNQYDKNALGVYINSGKLLGYIERDQRKLIKTLRENPKHFASVVEKRYLPPNEKFKNPFRTINIELWVGFPDYEIENERQKRIDNIKYDTLNNQLILQLNIFKETKDKEPQNAIETLEKVILKINKFNSESFSDRKFKLPLNEFTILTNKQGLFKKTVELGEKYINNSHLTDKQKVDISSRIEKAKEKIKII